MLFFRRKLRKIDRELGRQAISELLACRHLLFEDEAGYVICPSCGELLRERLPQDSRDKARLYLIQKKLKKYWALRLGPLLRWLSLFTMLSLPNILTRLYLDFNNYGFSLFDYKTRHHSGVMGTVAVGNFFLFIFFFGSEGFKRSNILTLAFKKGYYRLAYSWPVRLALFVLVLFFVTHYLPSYYLADAGRTMARHDYLTQAQRDRGVELYVFICTLSVNIVAAELGLYQLVDWFKTRRLKRANQVYLAGGS